MPELASSDAAQHGQGAAEWQVPLLGMFLGIHSLVTAVGPPSPDRAFIEGRDGMLWHLHSILVALRRLRQEPEQNTPAVVAHDLETLIIYVRILLDDVAKCSAWFFHPRQPPTWSWHKHHSWRRWSCIDPSYKEHLDRHKGWFRELKAMRDDTVHHGEKEIPVPQPGGGMFLINVTNRLGKASPPQDLRERVRKVVRGLFSFMNDHEAELKRRLMGMLPSNTPDGLRRQFAMRGPMPIKGWPSTDILWALGE